MTTTTLEASAPAATPAGTGRVAAGSGLSLAGIIRSEWIKLRSVRATAWSYALVVLISLGLAAIMSLSLDLGGAAGDIPAADQARFLVQAATFGVLFGQLAVAVLGVLVMSGEYSTGMIKSTLTAVPRRLPALWAKAAVLFVATFVVGALSTIGSFLTASMIVAGQGLHASLFDPDVILPVLGGALYLALVSVFALGIGAILRSSAGAIASVLGIVLLLPMVLSMIPAPWASDMLPYLISNAGVSMFGLMSFSAVPMEPWLYLLIVLGWLGVSLAGAAVLLQRRDA